MEKKSAAAKIFLDIVLLLAVGLPTLLIYVLVTPYQRGLFCNDNSIRYPYHEDTITETVVSLCGIVVPLISIMVIEVLNYKSDATRSARTNGHLHPLFTNCYQNALAFIFGALCTAFVTIVGKVTIGRLRPHFWDVCKPDIDCQFNTLYEYKVDFNCTSNDEVLTENARCSFPSGHSSTAWYTMTYFSIYIWRRVPPCWSPLLHPLCQLLLLLAAFYVSLSRVMDNAHHPTDVLAGSIIGILIAMLTVLVLPHLIMPKRLNEDSLFQSFQSTSSIPRMTPPL